jgi:hypothetical protein
MSELASVLELFGFLTIDEVTVDSLKKSFKTRILSAHPDKGGDDAIFDKMLRSYVYLTETIQRISGGRATLQNIVSPDELKEMRPDEIVNKFFEEFHNDEFNRRFEEQNKRETHGYSGWLSEGGKGGDGREEREEREVREGRESSDADVTPLQKAPFDHQLFEESVKKGKVVSSIILHPEAMAYVSSNPGYSGTLIIDDTKGSYTSDIFANPEYTDVYSAYTENNTICDKVTGIESKQRRTIEDIIAERAAAAALPLNDDELTVIQEFEKRKLDNATVVAAATKDYFSSADQQNSNCGLLNSYEGFVHRF